MVATKVQTGIHYWPRRKGPAFLAAGTGPWAERLFDPGEISDELSHIDDLAFDFVRVTLPWDWLQPDPGRLRTIVLDRLAAFLDAAADSGLTVQLAVAGQLGGTLFLPRWLLAFDPTRQQLEAKQRLLSEAWEAPLALGNLYEDEAFLSGQRHLWREIAMNFAAHPALSMLDLGAGGLIGSVPPRAAEAAVAWWQQLEEAAASGEHALTLLYTDTPSLLMIPDAPPLDQWQLVTNGIGLKGSPLRGYPARHGIDTEWPIFLLLLARTLAHTPVGCAELAVPTAQQIFPGTSLEEKPSVRVRLYAEEEQARFFGELLPTLYDIGAPFICHTVWADTLPDLYQIPPYDQNEGLRYSGIVRADGSEKEAAKGWRQFNERGRRGEAGQAARTFEIDKEAWYDRRTEFGYLKQLYRRFLDGEL